MDNKQRHKRLRQLISRLNKDRKKQAKKIDILCNDFVNAQRQFIKRLNTFCFAADFYESIVGASDLSKLIYIAGKGISEELSDANVVFFLRQQGRFQLHLIESDQPIGLQDQRLENCFGPELIENICRLNKVCRLDDMYAAGLQCNPAYLNNISTVTIPLGRAGSSLGFVLIQRPLENELTDEEINRAASITPGLSRAIQSCPKLVNTPE